LKYSEIEWPHLNNAPITEALLDIRLTPSNDIDLDALSRIGEQEEDTYPTKKNQFEYRGKIELKDKVTQTEVDTPKLMGYQFHAADSLSLFQTRLNGFTFNKLSPYESWETFRAEASRLWEIYKKNTNPISVDRIALRYINKIQLPSKFVLENYFNTYPLISKEITESNYENIFMQLTITDESIAASANISQAIEKLPGDSKVLYVFDIDVFKQADFANQDIWTIFEELHGYKNHIFYKSITPLTQKLFE